MRTELSKSDKANRVQVLGALPNSVRSPAGFFVGDCQMKRIPLTRGQFALVDDEDYEKVSKYKWCAKKVRYGGFVAVGKISNKVIYMHRFIMNTPKRMDTDHWNHQKLDNRKENLRICNRHQNMANSKPRKNCTSKFKGIYWHKRRRKWNVSITRNGKRLNLGYFDNEIEAAKIYDKKAKEFFGEFALSNF